MIRKKQVGGILKDYFPALTFDIDCLINCVEITDYQSDRYARDDTLYFQYSRGENDHK
jgi:hypothetical protein